MRTTFALIIVLILCLSGVSLAFRRRPCQSGYRPRRPTAPTTVSPQQKLTLPGKCPEFNAVPSMDTGRLAGDWFNLYSLSNGVSLADGGRCTTRHVKPAEDGGFLATVKFIDENDQEKNFALTFTPISGQNVRLASGQNFILTTIGVDYDNYHLTILCESDGSFYGYKVVVFTRQRTLSPYKLREIKGILRRNSISTDLTETNQQNCGTSPDSNPYG